MHNIPSNTMKPAHTSVLHSSYHHPVLREFHKNFHLTRHNLMYPIFVTQTQDTMEEIKSMPNQYRVGLDKLVEFVEPLIKKGLSSVLLFGVVDGSKKDERGSSAEFLAEAVKKLKVFKDLLIACDLCLCPYTSHGHCGILGNDGYIINNDSIERLSEIAVCYAKAGAHIIAPSDMMDGRVRAIKIGLENAGLLSRVSVMSYSAKFASAFYGPFRDAANSAPSFGDRKAYQLPPYSSGLARRAILRDIDEGADIVMVKPGYPYLDIVKEASEVAKNHPLAVYQVSGEYSMLYHAAKTHNLFNFKDAVLESINSYLRAGATIIITYFTPEILPWLQEQ